MAKIVKKDTPSNKLKAHTAKIEMERVEQKTNVTWYIDFRIHALLVGLLAIIFYMNTYSNEYALDDNLIIVKNEYVYEGLAGLGDIMTKDAFDSYTKQANSSNQLSGGRYRPLSIATFAIEQQFFGAIPTDKVDSVVSYARTPGPQETKLLNNMHVRHVLNVFWYALCVITLLYFLRYIVFKNDPMIALIAAVIFTIHPIHTEVVANVKSRDEIMSLFFICCTFIFAFRYNERNKKWLLVAGLLSYLLAFLSKEYAVTLLVLLPLAFYLFNNYTISKSLSATLPYLAVIAVYAALRLHAVQPGTGETSTDVWNNPYALAGGGEKLATEIATNLNYLKLLLFPHPLTSDYSYNHIPYKNFGHPLVWLSIMVHCALFIGLVYFFRKRHVICFAIAFYLFNLLLISNIIFDIGATMGERLIFHSSVGFAIALAFLLFKGTEKVLPGKSGATLLVSLMLVIILMSGFAVIKRNADWKNNFTLFTSDIKIVPNSLLVNANLGVAYIDIADTAKDTAEKKKLLREGITLLYKALTLQTTCISARINKGLGYFRLEEPDSAKASFDKVLQLYPTYPKLPELYYNLGVLYFKRAQYAQAAGLWKTTLKLNPNYGAAQNALGILQQNVPEAVK